MKSIRLLLILGLLLLAGCAQNNLGIGTSLEVCCPGDYDEYHTYTVEVVDMPIFLRDYLVAEFDQAFQEKGLERNDQRYDLRVVLSYNHINLDPEQQDINPFVRVEAMSTELNYIAQVKIEMFEARSDKLAWAGSISRIHQVAPGEYMHEERARPAFVGAFREVLEDYPAPD